MPDARAYWYQTIPNSMPLLTNHESPSAPSATSGGIDLMQRGYF
jgi:hypothetical protein